MDSVVKDCIGLWAKDGTGPAFGKDSAKSLSSPFGGIDIAGQTTHTPVVRSRAGLIAPDEYPIRPNDRRQ
ncbi:hypothetical protein M011DRAFT_481816 [Sporormia fimetaria CBS 119925]|uniref:Uncharacterized protein n=1 Tax=Sporormia fimetaria CBS 119925 TaxID=1340428 RepID=A0A6A6UVP4_9PLEO|nr:hypothetical protein M011DRAFT_481816 [Sporormia fimetaria CBS 119925]